MHVHPDDLLTLMHPRARTCPSDTHNAFINVVTNIDTLQHHVEAALLAL